MRILIACERSGAVRDEFRNLGHDAWSCDLCPDDKGSRYHIRGDALSVAYRRGPYCIFRPWDCMVGHPPCTFLCNSSVHLLHSDRPQEANRWTEMRMGAYFFLQLWAAPIEKVCLENPVMHCHAMDIIQIEPAQTIQPFEFGNPESKRTGLWLRALPVLQKQTVQQEDLFLTTLSKPASGHWENQTASGQNKLSGTNKETARIRSNTYRGIAQAMAEQWGQL